MTLYFDFWVIRVAPENSEDENERDDGLDTPGLSERDLGMHLGETELASGLERRQRCDQSRAGERPNELSGDVEERQQRVRFAREQERDGHGRVQVTTADAAQHPHQRG